MVANKLAQRGKVMSSFSHDPLVYANMGKKMYFVLVTLNFTPLPLYISAFIYRKEVVRKIIVFAFK